MKIRLSIPRQGEHECWRPEPEAEFVAVRDWLCACGETNCVRSDQRIIGSDDRSYYGAAYCIACRCGVGTLHVLDVPTMFGLNEDHAVLHGRARVYG